MKFTDNALKQFQKIINESENPATAIRFYTSQGCCSPSLQMTVAENPSKEDTVIKMNDVDFFVTPEAEKILSKLTLDYGTEGFRSIKDENAGGCCS